MTNSGSQEQPQTNLQSEEARFREIVERASEVICTLNADGIVTYVNPAIRKLTGFSPDEWIGREITAFILPDWRERVLAHFHEQIRERRMETTLDYPIITRHGMVKWVEQSMMLLYRQGNFESARAILRDVTERVKAEEARKKLRSMQADFVSMVTHELRTPLTSILGYVQLLVQSEELSETHRKQLRIVDVNARRLRQLVDDILQMSQLESGRFGFQNDVIDLREILEEVAEAFQFRADEKGLMFEPELPYGVLVCGDRTRLTQVFSNLLSNAIKYTDTGRIFLGMSSDGNHVTVEVSDTGIGISPEDQRELFQRFFRSTSPKVQKTRGMGLGLNITKALVEHHQGEISVKSELGKGTTFKVSLPLHKPESDKCNSSL